MTLIAIICAAHVAACSSSDSDSTGSIASQDTAVTDLQITDSTTNTLVEQIDDDLASDVASDLPSDSVEVIDASTDNGADPQNPNATQVTFNIAVPAYVSDSLLVRASWAGQDIAVQWVGDELWSVTHEFPTDTESALVITFFDDNGAVTLGTVEQIFKTGINAAQTLDIAADQFDTERFDSNNNGVSNLDELIAGGQMPEPVKVLLFSETRDYRHPSIEDALVALQEIAVGAGIKTDLAGDSSGVFTDANLGNYGAVVWVLTSGDVLDESEQASFENYIQSGGGFAGIHAASDTEYQWPWYGELVGAYFEDHPDIQTATQNLEDGSHPSTAHLNLTWTRTDEWYNYNTNPRARVNVLLSLDETSYSGGTMGDDHPSAWYHAYDGGRAWYTGGGHTSESYAEPEFRTHLLGGLRYAAGIDN